MTDPLHKVRRRVSDALYGIGPGRYYQPAYHHIAQSIGLEAGAFLDVGCGPGWLCVHVAAGQPDIDAIGIDRSESMVVQARTNKKQRLNITIRRMEATEIMFPDATFDAAAAVQCAHHWERPEAVIAEVHRVLRPGGRFFVYEARRELDTIPEGWIAKRGAWPPDAMVRLGWRRFGMDGDEWEQLKERVRTSPFGGGEDAMHGFYRRLVLTK